jgi:DNA helicase-2/ATP-dependent DNA helicase PcrA
VEQFGVAIGVISSFVSRDDEPPYWRSKKTLSVDVTRARVHTLILQQVFPACSIMAERNL